MWAIGPGAAETIGANVCTQPQVTRSEPLIEWGHSTRGVGEGGEVKVGQYWRKSLWGKGIKIFGYRTSEVRLEWRGGKIGGKGWEQAGVIGEKVNF